MILECNFQCAIYCIIFFILPPQAINISYFNVVYVQVFPKKRDGKDDVILSLLNSMENGYICKWVFMIHVLPSQQSWLKFGCEVDNVVSTLKQRQDLNEIST